MKTKEAKKKMEQNKMELRTISILNDTDYYLLDAKAFIALDLFSLQSNPIRFILVLALSLFKLAHCFILAISVCVGTSITEF